MFSDYHILCGCAAKDNELRNTLHESFNLDESLANILKSHGAVPEDHLIQEVRNISEKNYNLI